MADQVLSLKISLPALQGMTLRKLQRLVDILRFSKVGATLVGSGNFPQLDFLTLNPSQNTHLSLDAARAAALDWHVLHCLRDAIEAVSAFLEDVRLLADIYQLTSKGEIKGSEWNAVLAQNRPFHRLGLPDKIQKIKASYGVSRTSTRKYLA